jgi:hypothetical protein
MTMVGFTNNLRFCLEPTLDNILFCSLATSAISSIAKDAIKRQLPVVIDQGKSIANKLVPDSRLSFASRKKGRRDMT